jgi:hypothetical protein
VNKHLTNIANDTTGLDAPNVMWPASWILLGIVVAAILTGVTIMVVRLIKSRVPWKKLPAYPSAAYFGKNHEPDVALLAECLQTSMALLAKHSQLTNKKWTFPQVEKALRGVCIYVMDVDKWPETNSVGTPTGQTIAGAQIEERLIVGKNLAAFLHECAHRCEEEIDNERDMKHLTWVEDGIRAADEEFSAWLAVRAGPR